jgi:dihydrolipoamide dehydrogenase
MMSGVNNAINYIELMRFGHAEAIDGSVNTPAITYSLL